MSWTLDLLQRKKAALQLLLLILLQYTNHLKAATNATQLASTTYGQQST
jgi:hypothetical protein